MGKPLVVFYSRTGTTRQVADYVARGLDADQEEIVDATDRKGLLGYARSGFDALFGRRARLRPFRGDLLMRELVVVGSPVWNRSLATPVRTFLHENQDRIRQVAFFVTCKGRGSGRALKQMAQAVGRDPIVELVVTEQELARGDYELLADHFVAATISASTMAPEWKRHFEAIHSLT